jgi:hypothetical protein
MMPAQESDHCSITSSLPRSHHAQIGRLSRSSSAATASLNLTGTSIDASDPRQFDECATKSIDGKPRRHIPRVLLLSIGMPAPGNPSLGRTLVAPGHCAQRTKEKRRFLWRGLAVRRSYAVKCGQEGRLIPCAELCRAGHGAFWITQHPRAFAQFICVCPAQPVSMV